VLFLIDAQLPPGLAKLFRDAGHEASHVSELGLLGARDRQIAAHALRTGSVIVTKDEDFVTMRHTGASAPRVLWLRIGNTTNRALAERLRPHLDQILSALEKGENLVEVR
jgi:predicted nuclease of predicted toxin-antitoxin system